MGYLKAITPLNIAEEKEKSFDSRSYSPQFLYKWDDASINKCKEKEVTPHISPLLNALVHQDSAVIVIKQASYSTSPLGRKILIDKQGRHDMQKAVSKPKGDSSTEERD